MTEPAEGEFDLGSLNDEELTEQVHDDLYNGLKTEVEEATRIFLKRGWSAERVLNDALVEGMRIVGIDFRDGILFVPEVLLAANSMKGGMEILRPLLAETGVEPIGKIVIGTVKGDIHDIGKNLVATILSASGFQIFDLGTSVTPEQFVAKAKEVDADIVGISALLTTTMAGQKAVIEALDRNGLRPRVKAIIGGAAVTQRWAAEIGADGYSRNAIDALELAKNLMSKGMNKGTAQA
jgi:corrinoid protein of di/trimethylamine methyltransferase